jgi:hypothetical protein
MILLDYKALWFNSSLVPLLVIILSFNCWQCITTTCIHTNPWSTHSELLHIITKVIKVLCSHGRVKIMVFRYVTSCSLYPENQGCRFLHILGTHLPYTWQNTAILSIAAVYLNSYACFTVKSTCTTNTSRTTTILFFYTTHYSHGTISNLIMKRWLLWHHH